MTLEEAKSALKQQVAEDDRNTFCPCCSQRCRNDQKGMTQWQALALKSIYDFFKDNPSSIGVHAADLVKDTDGARDHGVALLRHWGLIMPVGRPPDADPNLKGSRGLSGYYVITEEGRGFVEGWWAVPKNIVKPFGMDGWRMSGPQVTFEQVLGAVLATDESGMILDGKTAIEGVEEAV